MISPTDRPLAGLTIIDLSRVLAGPFCTMTLADQGARVIKVELPGSGDEARAFGPEVDGVSGYFSSINRGKESIALDLKTPAGQRMFDELLAQADVLVENFRPGVMERFGYSWERLHATHPRLIVGSLSGFGKQGSPYSARPAYDMIIQGMSGMMSVTGQPGGPPTRVGVSIADLTAGLYLAMGLSMALYRRERTGCGTQVDLSMLDCQLALLEYPVMRHLATGETPGPVGTYRPGIAPPWGPFRSADGYVILAVGNDRLFARLCAALGQPALAQDPRFAGGEARKDHEPALQQALDALLCTETTAFWCAHMAAAGVPCGPINTVNQMLADPHVAGRGMLLDVEGPGPASVVASPLRFAGVARPASVRAAPALDQDRARILADYGIADA